MRKYKQYTARIGNFYTYCPTCTKPSTYSKGIKFNLVLTCHYCLNGYVNPLLQAAISKRENG